MATGATTTREARAPTTPIPSPPGRLSTSRSLSPVEMTEDDPYRFRADESVVDGVRRIYRDRVAVAAAAAGDALDGDAGPGEAVHDVRVAGKELRGLLRLVRESLDEAAYDALVADVRAVNDPLAESRDAAVSVRVLAKLDDGGENDGEADEDGSDDGDRAALTALDAVRPVLADLAEGADAVALNGTGFETLAGGLRRTYRTGRERRERAVETGDPDDSHRWRTTVKAHECHVRLLVGAWPATLDAREAEVHRLGTLLGDAHDRAVAEAALGADDDRRDRLADDRAALEADARSLGARVYAERPKPFVSRFRAYWRAWR